MAAVVRRTAEPALAVPAELLVPGAPATLLVWPVVVPADDLLADAEEDGLVAVAADDDLVAVPADDDLVAAPADEDLVAADPAVVDLLTWLSGVLTEPAERLAVLPAGRLVVEPAGRVTLPEVERLAVEPVERLALFEEP